MHTNLCIYNVIILGSKIYTIINDTVCLKLLKVYMFSVFTPNCKKNERLFLYI